MKIAVFVDYWNFQLTLNQNLSKNQGTNDYRAKIDWRDLGSILTTESCEVLGVQHDSISYEGCYIYTSYNPATVEGKKYRNWTRTWLDRQPGVNVEARERKPKALPCCSECHQQITHCPHTNCGKPINATVEKGVDTLLVTDLIRLGFTDSYDVAVLASSDADMIPAVSFMQTKGKKVIQAGFPPQGINLATECWGSFDVMKIVGKILRD